MPIADDEYVHPTSFLEKRNNSVSEPIVGMTVVPSAEVVPAAVPAAQPQPARLDRQATVAYSPRGPPIAAAAVATAAAVGKSDETEADMKYRELRYDELVFKKEIGKGAFGTVHRGKWRHTKVGIKVLHANVDDKTINELRREAALMNRLSSHPNILHFIGIVVDPPHICIVMDFCSNGSLFDYLVTRNSPVSHVQLVRMMRDAASGIAHLHHEGVLHRDIATRNCLVKDDLKVVISDFGTSRVLQDDATVVASKSDIGPVRWMAPESLRDKTYSPASDVYMFGVMMWEMLYRKLPYPGLEVLNVAIMVMQRQLRPEIEPDCDVVLEDIMRSCWQEDPSARYSMERICKILKNHVKLLNETAGSITSSDSSAGLQSSSSSMSSAASVVLPANSSNQSNYADVGGLGIGITSSPTVEYQLPQM